jgi:hypothetical protein
VVEYLTHNLKMQGSNPCTSICIEPLVYASDYQRVNVRQTHEKEDRQEDRQEHRQYDRQAVGQLGSREDSQTRQTYSYDVILVSLTKPELYGLIANTLAQISKL